MEEFHREVRGISERYKLDLDPAGEIRLPFCRERLERIRRYCEVPPDFDEPSSVFAMKVPGRLDAKLSDDQRLLFAFDHSMLNMGAVPEWNDAKKRYSVGQTLMASGTSIVDVYRYPVGYVTDTNARGFFHFPTSIYSPSRFGGKVYPSYIRASRSGAHETKETGKEKEGVEDEDEDAASLFRYILLEMGLLRNSDLVRLCCAGSRDLHPLLSDIPISSVPESLRSCKQSFASSAFRLFHCLLSPWLVPPEDAHDFAQLLFFVCVIFESHIPYFAHETSNNRVLEILCALARSEIDEKQQQALAFPDGFEKPLHLHTRTRERVFYLSSTSWEKRKRIGNCSASAIRSMMKQTARKLLLCLTAVTDWNSAVKSSPAAEGAGISSLSYSIHFRSSESIRLNIIHYWPRVSSTPRKKTKKQQNKVGYVLASGTRDIQLKGCRCLFYNHSMGWDMGAPPAPMKKVYCYKDEFQQGLFPFAVFDLEKKNGLECTAYFISAPLEVLCKSTELIQCFFQQEEEEGEEKGEGEQPRD